MWLEELLNIRLIHMDKYLDFLEFDIEFPSRISIQEVQIVTDLDYFRQISPDISSVLMQIETISKMIGRIWSLSRGIPRRLSVKMLKSNLDTVLLLLSESFTVYIPTKRKWPARSCGLQNWFENCQMKCRWYEFDLELKRSFGNNSMVLSFSWPHGLLSVPKTCHDFAVFEVFWKCFWNDIQTNLICRFVNINSHSNFGQWSVVYRDKDVASRWKKRWDHST